MTKGLIGLFVVFLLLCMVEPATGMRLPSPGSDSPMGQVILQVPYGIKNSDVMNSTGLVVRDSVITSMVIVESYSPAPFDANLTVEIPKPFLPVKTGEEFEIREEADKYVLSARFRLVTEFDDWYRLLHIRIPATIKPDKYLIRAKACLTGPNRKTQNAVIDRQATIRVVAPEELDRLLMVPSINIPADMEGKMDEKKGKNCLVLRSGLGFLGKLLGSGEDDDVLPVSFVAVHMINRADEDAAVLIGWEVLDQTTGQEARGFRISKKFLELHGGGDDRIYSQILAPAGQAIDFTLPIFADRERVLAGRYVGRVYMKLFGSETMLLSREFALTVRKMSWSSIATTLYAIGVAIAVGLFLMARHPRLLRRFKTRWLILIALFGSVKFMVSLVPRVFLNELFNGLLGPFSGFATGLIREGMTSVFVMALVVLVPLPGVVTLSMLMSMVLICMMGNFSPVYILFMAVSMSTMEIALYLTGFTREKGDEFTRTKTALLLAALGVGAANAFATFVDYNLLMLLHRLYYAKWFVLANIIVVGFLYSALFAPAGVMLGNRLRRVATE
ncbi:hypothetical protein [Desulfosarcina ovata]|uniref:Uncharacterized protein n=1 Tax=Desulfosarcina ovata subsp. ovata TaxID=2752305 RepID=A0A5K8A9C3_9BACT|nr:hypothetical protein [Desulfosarcina ovata]BBO89165.1 hypothetical protein DSCOOX_23450 [Desulfosarcina ovata subsp. ovata]